MDASKLKLPILLVGTLLSAVAIAGWNIGTRLQNLEDLRARTEQMSTRLDVAEREAAKQQLRTLHVEDSLSNLTDMVKEIRSDVKDLKRR